MTQIRGVYAGLGRAGEDGADQRCVCWARRVMVGVYDRAGVF